MNFHPGSSEGKLRPNFNCCYLQYQRASSGLLDLWGGERFSWVTSRQGPLSGQVCFFSTLVLTLQQTLITASLSPAVVPVPRSAREPTVGTSCLCLCKVSRKPLKSQLWDSLLTGTQLPAQDPPGRDFDTHLPFSLAHPSLTALECAAPYAFLKRNQGVIHLLYVC